MRPSLRSTPWRRRKASPDRRSGTEFGRVVRAVVLHVTDIDDLARATEARPPWPGPARTTEPARARHPAATHRATRTGDRDAIAVASDQGRSDNNPARRKETEQTDAVCDEARRQHEGACDRNEEAIDQFPSGELAAAESTLDPAHQTEPFATHHEGTDCRHQHNQGEGLGRSDHRTNLEQDPDLEDWQHDEGQHQDSKHERQRRSTC